MDPIDPIYCCTCADPDHPSRLTSRHSRPASREPGRRAIMRSSARPCRSSAKSSARPSTCAPDRRCSTSRPATATPRLAAARRWCDVVATDYVPALLDRARERADAERLDIGVPRGRRGGAAVSRRALRCRRLDLRRDVHARPGPRRRRAGPRLQAGRQDRPRQLDAGGLHRPAVQDDRQARSAAGRRQIAGALGHAGPPQGAVREPGGVDQSRAAAFRFPLSLAGALARRLQDPITDRCSRHSARLPRPSNRPSIRSS